MFIGEIAYRASIALKSGSIRFIMSESKRMAKLLYNHPEYVMNAIRRSNIQVNSTLEHCNLLIRHPLLAQKSHITKFTLMPHIAYPPIDFKKKKNDGKIRLGAMGFATESKNFNQICDLAIRLNVPLVLLMSITEINPKAAKMHMDYANDIRKKYGGHKNIYMKIGYFTPDEMLYELSNCSHIISAQNEAKGSSGSMRFAMRLGIPIISSPNFQANEAQTNIKPIDEITLSYLKKTKATNLDDGFVYLRKVLEM